MSNEKDPSQQSDRSEFMPPPSNIGEDVSALISGLIAQNAELVRKLQQIDSQSTPREHAVSDDHDALEEPEAKAEVLNPVNEAIQEGHFIIQKAEEKAESIIEEARGQARTILAQASHKADQKDPSSITEAEKRSPEGARLNPQKNAGVDSAALYDGVVELLFPPPIVVGSVLKLKRHLKAKVRTRMVGVGVSRYDGVSLKLRLPQPTPLVKVIKALPEVREVSAERWIKAKSRASGKTVDNLPTGRLTVKMNP